MNNYFFSNQTWGECYTVMAENKNEAIKTVKRYIREEDDKLKSTLPYVERVLNTVGEIEINDYKFDIIEFKDGEVIETEYA